MTHLITERLQTILHDGDKLTNKELKAIIQQVYDSVGF